jgi:hypothetical protein
MKTLIILFAEPGRHESLGRALHALLYAKELKESKLEVKLIFDGGGTKWASDMVKPDNILNSLFTEVKEMGIIDGICDYCIGAFKADRTVIEDSYLPIAGEYDGHPSIAKYIKEGYQVITL